MLRTPRKRTPQFWKQPYLYFAGWQLEAWSYQDSALRPNSFRLVLKPCTSALPSRCRGARRSCTDRPQSFCACVFICHPSCSRACLERSSEVAVRHAAWPVFTHGKMICRLRDSAIPAVCGVALPSPSKEEWVGVAAKASLVTRYRFLAAPAG